jgi:hypothetical protein
MQFSIDSAHPEDLLARHRDLVQEASDDSTTAERKAALRVTMADIDRVLSRYLRIERVDQNDTALLEQLVGRDEVHEHGARSVDELRALRAGRAGDNKIVVAYLNPYTRSKVPQILSAIYIYKHTGIIPSIEAPRTNGHAIYMPDYTALPGNIPAINDPECRPVDDTIRALIFYSITSIKEEGTTTHLYKGAGEKLINHLFPFVEDLIAQKQLPFDVIASTLSPLRSLVGAYRDSDFNLFTMDDEQLTHAAVKHMLTGRDPVQRFHGGNGVMFGDIKLRANTPDSNDGRGGAGAMVNFIYDLDAGVRRQRLELFKSKQFAALLAPHLQHYAAMPQLAARPNMAQYRQQ